MKLFFKGNEICTKLKVSSTVKTWSKEYEATIDTGAFNTAIPKKDIRPDVIIPQDIRPDNLMPSNFNLKYSHTHGRGWGVGYEGYWEVYFANLLIGEEDEYSCVHVVGADIPAGKALIGREIVSKFEWRINYKLKTVDIFENP